MQPTEYDYLLEHPHDQEAWFDWLSATANGLALDDETDREMLARNLAGVLQRWMKGRY